MPLKGGSIDAWVCNTPLIRNFILGAGFIHTRLAVKGMVNAKCAILLIRKSKPPTFRSAIASAVLAVLSEMYGDHNHESTTLLTELQPR